MKRREFITLVGAAAAWPFAGRARAMSARIRTDPPSLIKARILVASAFALLLVEADQVQAQTMIDLKYSIIVAKISTGEITASAELAGLDYVISANARITGVMRFLSTGEGSSVVRGAVKDGRLTPSTLESQSTFAGEPPHLTVEFRDGRVTKYDPPPVDMDRVPIADGNLVGVVDPLTALLMPNPEQPRQACQDRILPIFDGHVRYDLKLAFQRTDVIKADRVYAGPVVICHVTFVPIAGHRPSHPLMQLLSGRGIEATLANVPGTVFLAPYRLSIESILANVVVQATRFESQSRPRAQ